MKTFKELVTELIASTSINDVKKKFKKEWAAVKSGREDLGSPKMQKFYDALFDFYASSGEMPYGTMKARTGDPLEWIEDRFMNEGIRGPGTWGNPPYYVVALKGKKIVGKPSGPIKTTALLDTAIGKFIKNHDDDTTIIIKDKTGKVVYTHDKPGTWLSRSFRVRKEDVDEGTSAKQRGEVQSPRSQKEYDALSPKDKKLVDARIKKARAVNPSDPSGWRYGKKGK